MNLIFPKHKYGEAQIQESWNSPRLQNHLLYVHKQLHLCPWDIRALIYESSGWGDAQDLFLICEFALCNYKRKGSHFADFKLPDTNCVPAVNPKCFHDINMHMLTDNPHYLMQSCSLIKYQNSNFCNCSFCLTEECINQGGTPQISMSGGLLEAL